MKPYKRVYVEITNVCNLSCSFCPPSKRKPSFMNVDEVAHIFSQISRYTDYVYLHVKGEPLLHPGLKEILNLGEKYHLKVNITTNGTLLTKVKPILQKAKALRQINISLHSFENSLDEPALLAYLQDVFAVTKELQSTTDTIIALRLWNLDRKNVYTSLKKRNQLVLSQIEEAFALQTPIMEQFYPSHNSSDNTAYTHKKGIALAKRIYLNQDYEFVWPALDAPFIGEHGFCYGLKHQFAILVDGTVVPCCLDNDGTIALGNIFEENLDSILGGSRSITMREGFSNRCVVEELCKHCGYRDRFGE